MVNEQYQLDIYRIDTKAKIDKRKVWIILLIILSLLCIFLTGNYIIKIMAAHKTYKQYEMQLNEIKHQEEMKLQEEERKRQEKIPKLTEVRKTKHGENLSIRNKKSFFNF